MPLAIDFFFPSSSSSSFLWQINVQLSLTPFTVESSKTDFVSSQSDASIQRNVTRRGRRVHTYVKTDEIIDRRQHKETVQEKEETFDIQKEEEDESNRILTVVIA